MTMRGKMARRVFDYISGPDADWNDGPDGPHRTSKQDLAFQITDAALDALMEPTEAMCSQGWGQDMADDAGCAQATFKAMIRAAKDGP